MKTAVTLVRRELWEHPALYVGPLVVLALVLVGVIGKLRLVASFVAEHGAEETTALLHLGAAGFAVPFLLVMLVVTSLYLLDSLYAERKDRSILFWKSMPVSDVATVLSKLAVALVLAPLIAYVVATIAQILSLGIGHATVALNAASAPTLRSGVQALVSAQAVLFYALFAVSLWYAPVYGWLLLVSAWAKRLPLLWASLVPVALVVLEQELFGSRHLAAWIGYRLSGIFSSGFQPDIWMRDQGAGGDFLQRPSDVIDLIAPGQLLASTGLWTGFAAAAVFTAVAIGLRRYRDET
ncbi:ABC transporter permease [soil metagenome]